MAVCVADKPRERLRYDQIHHQRLHPVVVVLVYCSCVYRNVLVTYSSCTQCIRTALQNTTTLHPPLQSSSPYATPSIHVFRHLNH